MPRYGSFSDTGGNIVESINKCNTKNITKLPPEKLRISSISVGVAYDTNNQPISANTFGSVLSDVTSEVDLNTVSESDTENKPRYEPHILEKSFEKTVCYHLRCRKKTSNWVISLLCVLTIISNAAVLIITPIYTSSMKKVGGDEVVVLLSLAGVIPIPLILLSLLLKHAIDKTITLKPTASVGLYAAIGVCQCLRLNMFIFSSHPHKTPHALQPGLSGAVIPFSVIVTLIIIRRGFSKRRLTCCVVALVGMFVSVEPGIWSMEGSDTRYLFFSHDLAQQILWPVIYSLSYLPLVIYYVVAEKQLRQNTIHAFSLSTSGMLSASVFTVLIFGVDFLPWYGNVTNFSDFLEHLKTGFRCNFSYDPDCQFCLVKLIVLSASVALFNIFSVLLVSVSEGTVFTSLVVCVSAPIASGFWSVFHYDYDSDVIAWRPWWSNTTTFLIVSVAFLVPTAVCYGYFSNKDAKEAKREKNGYSDVSSSEYEWE